MLLPLSLPPVQIGPPTEFARKMRSWMMVVLIFQTIVCVCRLALLLDIMGGFIMLIMTGMGWYALKDMHITFITSWGFLCLINGVFDMVRLVDYMVNSPSPILPDNVFSWSALLLFIQLAIPVSTLCGAATAWSLYSDFSVQTLPLEGAFSAGFPDSGASAYGALGCGDGRYLNLHADRRAMKEPFAGKGHRLGAD
jgi:hypothetical protein